MPAAAKKRSFKAAAVETMASKVQLIPSLPFYKMSLKIVI